MARSAFLSEEQRSIMSKKSVVFLLDVDNTLIDNDVIISDLRRYLAKEFRKDRQDHYWKLFEEHKKKYGYADYLGALQQYRCENECDPHFVKISLFLLEYPFAERVYAQTFEIIDRFDEWGQTVLFSEGDVVFQPHKIERSGLRKKVKDRVLIYIQKERQFEDVEDKFPADRYVMVDDSLKTLGAAKAYWGDRLTTVFVRQGKKAEKEAETGQADITLSTSRELLQLDLAQLF